MSPSEAKKDFGATHYLTTSDGVTPTMYYKKVTTNFSDGTSFTGWGYLSFANLWQNSDINTRSKNEREEFEKRLVKIK